MRLDRDPANPPRRCKTNEICERDRDRGALIVAFSCASATLSESPKSPKPYNGHCDAGEGGQCPGHSDDGVPGGLPLTHSTCQPSLPFSC
jgi:hypothetical protein